MDSLRLKRFRCLEDTGFIDFAPLNILVGANSSGKSSFIKFFYLLKQTIRENRRGVFLWNSQNANSVDFKDFTNTVKDGEGSIEVQFSIREMPILSVFRRATKTVDNIIVSLKISKQDEFFDYLEKLKIEFGNQQVECHFDKERKSTVIINGETLDFKNERRLTCHTNSLLPTFKFWADKIDDDDCSYKAKEEMMDLLPKVEQKPKSFYRLVRNSFMSKEKFFKVLEKEYGETENKEKINN